LQRKLPLDPIQFRFPPVLFAVLHFSEGFGQQGQPFLSLPNFAIHFGEYNKWLSELNCSRGPPSGYPLVHLGNSFFSFPLLGQRPSSHE
jgi:hypothetical protein